MPFYNFDDFLQVVVGILVTVKSIGELFQCLKEAIEIHLIIVRSAHNVLINDVVMCLKNMTISQSRVLRKSLELGACNKIVTFLTS